MTTGTYSVALSAQTHDELRRHLWRADGQEDLCFALWYPSEGETRMTALVAKAVLPEPGDRRVHGNASFLPQFFERALSEAVAADAGLAFLHSHPAPGWQDMSSDDVRAEAGHAAATLAMTGLPLVGMTLGATDGAWSARFWEKAAPRRYVRRPCTHVRVAGESLAVTYHDSLLKPPRLKPELRRTVSAWGQPRQADLARLHVGIVGAGSVGAIVAETLARTGIRHISLIDFDAVESVNLDRLLHATRRDARVQRAKASMLARALSLSATADNFTAHGVEYSVCEEEGFRAALDCDVLFSCVDRPWPRAVLNLIAYAHLIPVVDGGIRVGVCRNGDLRRADWKVHIASPGRRCLECLDQYNPADVSLEREGFFDDPSYISGLPDDHHVRRNENVFAFSLSAASFEILQMLTMTIAPCGIANVGEQMYHLVPGFLDPPSFRVCTETCLYPSFTGKGDRVGIKVTGRHPVAEAARARRAAKTGERCWRDNVAEWLYGLADRLNRNLDTHWRGEDTVT
jgi:molybdopterin/thiamine biosynthesis adenylyltransferase